MIEESGESKLKLRKIVFYDRVLKRKFELLTNLFEVRPDIIAAIYKIRGQIELLFKHQTVEIQFPTQILPW